MKVKKLETKSNHRLGGESITFFWNAKFGTCCTDRATDADKCRTNHFADPGV
jgi:hypothetical protein